MSEKAMSGRSPYVMSTFILERQDDETMTNPGKHGWSSNCHVRRIDLSCGVRRVDIQQPNGRLEGPSDEPERNWICTHRRPSVKRWMKRGTLCLSARSATWRRPVTSVADSTQFRPRFQYLPC